MGLTKPFAFMAGAAAGGIVTDQLIHYYTNTADSFQYPNTTTWADLSNSAQSLDLTATIDFGSSVGGYDAWLVDNSTEYLDSDVNYSQTGITGYTTEAWIYYNGGQVTGQDKGMIYHYMWDQADQSESMYMTLGVTGANKGKLQAYIASATANKGHHVASTAVTNNTWAHVAWTLEPGTTGNLKFYLNGQPDGTADTTWSSFDAKTPNYKNLVGRQENGERSFSGYIGVVRAYWKTLSASEIEQNYDAGVI